ncbi:hypothetical protein C6495_18285 [Candidatus Poribacteria bacterium]|nr:MAG: hypothetical protein C6495_18285 [Candidatus Poribacteria bacterium]
MEARMQRTLLTLLFLMWTAIGTVFGDVYRIREGDTLLIAIIGQPEYTQTVQVREDGMMSYFSGELHVAGKTADEISRRIRDVLVSENLVSNPVIMVSPVPQENGIFVGGAVKTPGRYVISPKTDIGLYRAITLAGGTVENADVQQVQLIRANARLKTAPTEEKGIDARLKTAPTEEKGTDARLKTAPTAETETEMQPGTESTEGRVETYDISINQPYRDVRVNVRDLVFVMPLSVVDVQGQVQVPGKLFIRGKISIAEALARAGGLTAEADIGALVKVNRDGTLAELSVTEQFWKPTTNGKTTIQNGQSLLLSDGDVLFVPNAFKIEPIYVIGYVRNPGAQRVREPRTLAQAIALAGGFEETADRKNVTLHRRDGTSLKHPFTASSGTEAILLYPGDTLEIDKRFQLNWGLVSTFVSTASVLTTLIITLLTR